MFVAAGERGNGKALPGWGGLLIETVVRPWYRMRVGRRRCAHGIGCALAGGGAPMVFGAPADPCRRYSARRSLAFFSSFLSMATGSLTLARKIMAAMMYGLNEASL